MGKNEFLKVLPELVSFVRVAEHGSFSAAALELGLTPSAISRQISRLEKELHVQLIQRTTRQLRLTELGLEVFTWGRELVSAAQAAVRIADVHSEQPRGRVRISAPKAYAKWMLHPQLLRFLAQYPQVDVQLIVTDRDVDPIREDVDLMVRITDEPPSNLVARSLGRVDHILCATPQYLSRCAPIEVPHDLVGHSCLYLGEQTRDNHWRFRKGENRVEVVVHGRYVINHSEIRRDGVLAHLGVGCLPDFIAHEAMARGELLRVLPDWEFLANYHGEAYLIYPASRHVTPKCRVLIDFLVHACRDAWRAVTDDQP